MARIRVAGLPAEPNRLVGRDRELKRARAILLDPEVRLLTVTGPPGVGKTRFAVALASAEVADFADGAAFAPLGPLTDATQVAAAIGEALQLADHGAAPFERLQLALQHRELLLVLDNFEHVMPAALLVSELLSECEGLKVLVTSREMLHVSYEHEFRLSPLAVVDATALFEHRARAVQLDFRLDDENTRAVAAICERLDGLPLAIELAAARVKLLSLESLQERLGAPLGLLGRGAADAPTRQRTLRDAIRWSYDLLGEDERRVFRRISVFRGDFSDEAARVVADASFDGLASLVDKSLLHPLPEGRSGPRLAMLETIRECALELLTARGEEAESRFAHAAFYLALAEEAEPRLLSADREPWLMRLEHEHDNLRAALFFLLGSGYGEEALRLAAALAPFWARRRHAQEGRRWLQAALSGEPDPALPLQAKARYGGALLAVMDDDYRDALELGRQALTHYGELGDQRGQVLALSVIGLASSITGETEASHSAYEEALEVATRLGEPWLTADLHNRIGGRVCRPLGDWAGAERHQRESARIFRELGDPESAAYAELERGFDQVLLGQRVGLDRIEHAARTLSTSQDVGYALHALHLLARARLLLGLDVSAYGAYRQMAELARTHADHYSLALALPGFAQLAVAGGDARRGARLFGAAEGAAGSLRVATWDPSDIFSRGRRAAQAALGSARFAAAYAEGQRLALDQAIEYALDSRADGATAGLTMRELDVLRLVADGLSNAQIAERLVVSIRTVHAHLRSIYGKFEVPSRTAAIRYAVEHGVLTDASTNLHDIDTPSAQHGPGAASVHRPT